MNNLIIRIFTSLALLLLLAIGLFNDIAKFFLLLIVAVISFMEFKTLLEKIFQKNSIKKNLLNTIFVCYLVLFIFILNNTYKVDLLIILSVCIFSDIGGYVFGKLIGGKKLTKISPNKTISGSIGSFIFSLIPVIYYFYLNSTVLSYEFNYLIIIFGFLLISLICQLGDLFISQLKRKSKVKDTGKILPGHGGLLDRIDGILFAAPFGILLFKIFGNV